MNIINVTDYDYTTDYDNTTICNCTNNEHDFDIFIPVLLFTIPCGISFLCLISLMINNFVKALFNKK